MPSIVSINKTSKEGGVVFYHMLVRLPLRSITVVKRYSEFSDLVTKLCRHLGISVLDFPYELPPKHKLQWFSGNTVVEERRLKLALFFNAVISDRELQNQDPVRDFLNLPVNFKFSQNTFMATLESGEISELLLLSSGELDANSWQELIRKVKFHLADLNTSVSGKNVPLADRISAREKVNRYIEPSLSSLENWLPKLGLNSSELSSRRSSMKELEEQLSKLLKLHRDEPHSVTATATAGAAGATAVKGFSSIRNLGGPARETNETLSLSNSELMQQQIQIHQKQDQEVGELRKMVQRQRELGELINQEVAEQNDILDELRDDIDRTSDKLHQARVRTRKLG